MINKLFKDKDMKVVVADVVIALLAVLLFGMICQTIREYFLDVRGYSYSESSMMYRLEGEDYSSLVSMYHENQKSGSGDSRKLQEYYSVARYSEDAFFYKMFLEAGDEPRAERYRERMEEAASGMGEFAFHQKKIDARLGIGQ